MNKTYLSVAIAAVFALSACGGDNNTIIIAPSALATNAVALTGSNQLWSIDIAKSNTIAKRVQVTGLGSNEDLLGIDYRPADGKLYGITKDAVYVIDDVTGVASGRQALIASNSTLVFTAPLTGTNFGIDFNPVVDRMRVVSDSAMSLVVNVDTGAVNRQADIGTIGAGGVAITPQPTGFSITGAAYTNSISKPTSTRLWDIDTLGDRLFQQNAANNDSQLSGAVPLGVNATDVNGFDIDGANNKGYAALKVGSSVGLYAIDLAATDNAATLLASLGDGTVDIKGISLKTKTTVAYALTDDGKLLRFLPTNPSTADSSRAVSISGLASGEKVLGIDFRPADNKLYGITSSSRIITINKTTGAATVGGSLNLSLPVGDLASPVTYSVDFNPAADKLRVMNSNGLNLRIDVDKYTTTIDGMLSKTYDMPLMGQAPLPAAPANIKIIAAAYTNSFTPKPTSTMLYDLDVANQSLALQNANAGTFTYQGQTTPAFTNASMDIIGGSNGLPLIGLRDTGATSLFSINLATGAATAYPSTSNTIGAGMTAPIINDIALTFE